MFSLEELETLSGLLGDLAAADDGATIDTDLFGIQESAEALTAPQSGPTEKKRRRAKNSNLPYSTDIQRRRKAELEALRSQVRQLSGELNLLARSCDSHSHRTVPPSELPEDQHQQLIWRNRAMANWGERNRAVRTNLALKRIFSQQVKLLKSMRKVLRQNDIREGIKLIGQLQPTADRLLFRFHTSELMLAEISSNLAWMHLRTDLVMPTLGENLSVSFSSQAKVHGHCGTRIETTSLTPLACTVKEAGQILWGHATNQDASSIMKEAFNVSQTQIFDGGQTVYDRRCVTHLFIQNGELDTPRYANALGAYRKYEDKNQVHLVGRMRWFIPGDSIQLEDYYWTVIEPSPRDPEHSCVVRTYYLLEVRDTGMRSTLQGKSIRDLVLEAIAKKSRQFLQLMQNAFLDQAGLVMETSPTPTV
ncbi:hypothetical protein Pcac1_g1014 [Phytophthora cactorum]|nr:hypothetical protein Pcac1_g1014 [Phytophthora cactorum]